MQAAVVNYERGKPQSHASGWGNIRLTRHPRTKQSKRRAFHTLSFALKDKKTAPRLTLAAREQWQQPWCPQAATQQPYEPSCCCPMPAGAALKPISQGEGSHAIERHHLGIGSGAHSLQLSNGSAPMPQPPYAMTVRRHGCALPAQRITGILEPSEQIVVLKCHQ